MVALLTVLFILICPLIIFIILVQDPKGGGLAGVLGGSGGSSAFGAKTADVVMKTTVVLGMVFFLLALALGLTLRQSVTGRAESLAPEAPAPAESTAGEPAEGAVEGAAAGQTAPGAPAGESPGAGTGQTPAEGAGAGEAAPQPDAGETGQ